MKNSKFDIEQLDIFETVVEDNASDSVDEIKQNYKLLKEDAYKIAWYSITEKLYLPTSYYNLLFYVEISLKYYLLITSNLTIEEIERFSHNIPILINTVKEKNRDAERLKFLLDKIKMKNGKKLDMSKYYNYKYNKEIGNTPLIFEFEINEKEMKNIKEVIEWVSLHI